MLPSFSKKKSRRERIEGSERVAQAYEKVSGNPVNIDILLGTVIRVLPQQTRKHIQFQTTESSTFSDVKRRCPSYGSYESTTSSWSAQEAHRSLGVVAPPPAPASDGPVPMDIDQVAALAMALTKGRAKGIGKAGKAGKKGEKGREGKTDRGSNTKGQSKSGKSGTRSKAGGKGNKGKGKGQGQQNQPKCWNCGKFGYTQKD